MGHLIARVSPCVTWAVSGLSDRAGSDAQCHARPACARGHVSGDDGRGPDGRGGQPAAGAGTADRRPATGRAQPDAATRRGQPYQLPGNQRSELPSQRLLGNPLLVPAAAR